MIHVLSNQAGESGKGAAWGSALTGVKTMGGSRSTELGLLPFEAWAELRFRCAEGQLVTLEGPASEVWRTLQQACTGLMRQVPGIENLPEASVDPAVNTPETPSVPVEEVKPEERQVAFNPDTGEVLAVEPATAEKPKRGRRKVREEPKQLPPAATEFPRWVMVIDGQLIDATTKEDLGKARTAEKAAQEAAGDRVAWQMIWDTAERDEEVIP